MDINESKLRITGKVNLPSQLTIDKSYDFTCSNLEITGSQDRTNNDGTVDRTFIGNISELSEINIITEQEIITSKKKGITQSQVLRLTIEELWERSGSELEKEDFYIREMSKIINSYKQNE